MDENQSNLSSNLSLGWNGVTLSLWSLDSGVGDSTPWIDDSHDSHDTFPTESLVVVVNVSMARPRLLPLVRWSPRASTVHLVSY